MARGLVFNSGVTGKPIVVAGRVRGLPAGQEKPRWVTGTGRRKLPGLFLARNAQSLTTWQEHERIIEL